MKKIAFWVLPLTIVAASTGASAFSLSGILDKVKSGFQEIAGRVGSSARRALEKAKQSVRGFVEQFKMSTGIGVRPGGPLGRVPAIGGRVPALPLRASRRPRVVAFLRHVGCPFAEATARSLRAAARANPAIEWIAVTHSPLSVFRKWARDIGGLPGIKVVVDVSRRRYAQWGLGITGVGHFLGLDAVRALIKLATQGIRNRLPENGTRFQQAGTFGVDARGALRWRHLPAHAGDLPSFPRAAAALR